MAQQETPETTDYSRHTDEELREAIAKIDQQAPRVTADGSDAAANAAQRQRQQMQTELTRREIS